MAHVLARAGHPRINGRPGMFFGTSGREWGSGRLHSPLRRGQAALLAGHGPGGDPSQGVHGQEGHQGDQEIQPRVVRGGPESVTAMIFVYHTYLGSPANFINPATRCMPCRYIRTPGQFTRPKSAVYSHRHRATRSTFQYHTKIGETRQYSPKPPLTETMQCWD